MSGVYVDLHCSSPGCGAQYRAAITSTRARGRGLVEAALALVREAGWQVVSLRGDDQVAWCPRHRTDTTRAARSRRGRT